MGASRKSEGVDPEVRARQIRDRIRDNFDRGAESYELYEAESAFFRGLTESLLGLAPPREGASVLDVGCGTGASLEVLLDHTGPAGLACGIDISHGMAARAARRCRGRALVAVADGCDYGAVLRGPFDVVTYNAVLFMLPRWRESLLSARAVLGERGRVLLSYLEGVRLPRRGGVAVSEVLAQKGHRVGRHALGAWPDVADALTEIFGAVQVEELQREMTPHDFALFYGLEPMSAGLLPYLAYPERKEVVDELVQEFRRNGESVVQTWMIACAGACNAGRRVGAAGRE